MKKVIETAVIEESDTGSAIVIPEKAEGTIKDMKLQYTVNLMADNKIETVIYDEGSFIKITAVKSDCIEIQRGLKFIS